MSSYTGLASKAVKLNLQIVDIYLCFRFFYYLKQVWNVAC